MSAAWSPAPSRPESTIIRASRGGSASARRLLPSSVMRPSASSAPSSRSRLTRLLPRRRRRRIEERQLRRIGDAPLRQIEHQRRQIGAEDFRLGVGRERRGLRLVPQPVADAGLDAAGAAAALIDRGARGAHGFQPRQPDIRLVARHPREPAIDHDPHALDGQRGLRDRGRQHHLAPALRRRRNRAVLHGGIERAEQRHDLDRRVLHALGQLALGAADFRGAGQKRQHRAGIGAQRLGDRLGHLPLQRRVGFAAEIAGLDRKGAAEAFDHRRIAEQARHPRAVDGRRHHQDAQILAQALLRVARQRQAEIGVERALVEFVEQHRADAGQFRVVQDLPGEDAFGDHLDPGLARNFRAEAHPIADGVAGALAQRRRHPLGAGARRDPPRLQHDDLLVAEPRRVEQRQRHPRGLAGAGRRHQHRGVVAPPASARAGSAPRRSAMGCRRRGSRLMFRCAATCTASYAGLTRVSIFLGRMDHRVKPGDDVAIWGDERTNRSSALTTIAIAAAAARSPAHSLIGERRPKPLPSMMAPTPRRKGTAMTRNGTAEHIRDRRPAPDRLGGLRQGHLHHPGGDDAFGAGRGERRRPDRLHALRRRVRPAVPDAGLLPDLRPVPGGGDRPRLAHLSRPQGGAFRLFLRAVADHPVRLQGAVLRRRVRLGRGRPAVSAVLHRAVRHAVVHLSAADLLRRHQGDADACRRWRSGWSPPRWRARISPPAGP